MAVSLTLIRPEVDPVNTFRAQSVSQMYDVYSPSSLVYENPIDEALQSKESVIYIRNKTESHDLEVTISHPDYLLTSESKFIVSKNSTKKVSLNLNLNMIKSHIGNKNLSIESVVSINVKPLHVLGPVYVKNNLKNLPETV